MADITHLFRGGFNAYEEYERPEEQLRQAIQSAGLTPPDTFYFDGQLHRFNSGSKSFNKKDDSGWYVIYGDGIPAGSFGCWRLGITETWRANIGRELTPDERAAQNRRIAEARAQREAEDRLRHEQAARTAAVIWSESSLASDDHPYLKKKGIKSHGARVAGDGRLIVPLYDQTMTIHSLQYIAHDGEKRYHTGGSTKEKFCIIGDVASDGVLYVAEGFATAATIHEVTQRPCVVAYSASNLPEVVKVMSETHGRMDICIIADNDLSGVGQKYADQASAKYGCRVITMPEVGDANDYYTNGGDLKALLEPKQSDDWIISADDFASKPAPIKWLIKGWLERASLNLWFGEPGSGKTFVSLDAALTLSTDKGEWMGQRCETDKICLILAGEGHHGLKSRIKAWKLKNNYSSTRLFVTQSGCELDTPEGLQKVITSIKRMVDSGKMPGYPDAIFIDTLHRHMKGNENSAEEAGAMIKNCDLLRQYFNSAVAWIHHTGVNPDAKGRARGSSSFRGAVDNEVLIGNKVIEMKKSKNGEIMPSIGFEFEKIEISDWLDDEGFPTSSLVANPAQISDAPQQKHGSNPRTKNEEMGWKSYFDAAKVHGILLPGDKFGGLGKEAWREEFYKMHGSNNSSARQAFNRAVNGLMDRGEIRAEKDVYFLDGEFEAVDYIIIVKELKGF